MSNYYSFKFLMFMYLSVVGENRKSQVNILTKKIT